MNGNWLLVMSGCFDILSSSTFTVSLPENENVLENRMI